MKFDGTDTYPVGVLHALQTAGRAAKRRRWDLSARYLRQEWRYLWQQASRRNWRAVRNSFNGYLSEHGGHPHNCGRGWTKRAAQRRADRLCEEARHTTLPEWWPTQASR